MHFKLTILHPQNAICTPFFVQYRIPQTFKIKFQRRHSQISQMFVTILSGNQKSVLSSVHAVNFTSVPSKFRPLISRFFLIMINKTSFPRANKYADKGSSCLVPLFSLKYPVVVPLFITQLADRSTKFEPIV